MYYGAPPIVTNGLVLALDAGNTKSYVSGSTTWFDISGNNNSGSLVNGPTFSNQNGGCIVFDGVNDYVTSTSNINITGSSPRTFECWVYVSQSIDRNVMGGGTETNGTMFDTIIWSQGGYLRVIGHYYGGGFDTTSTLPSRNTINLSQWNHIVHIYDGTVCSLYTNGIFSNSSTLPLTTGNNTVKLGRGNFSGGYNSFPGRGGIFRVYNRALSQQEITQNYNATKTRFGLS
jgi:hypothetical protein